MKRISMSWLLMTLVVENLDRYNLIIENLVLTIYNGQEVKCDYSY